MPSYEFKCPQCERVITERYPMATAPAAVICPHCGTQAPRHYAGIRFAVHGGPTTGSNKLT